MGYEATAASASRLIARKGHAAVLSRKRVVGFNPVTGEATAPASPATENVHAVSLPQSAEYTDGVKDETLDRRERKKLLIGGTTTKPQAGDQIIIGTERWEVEGTVTLSPGGVNVLYTVGVVKA